MTNVQITQVSTPEGWIDFGIGQPDVDILPLEQLAKAATHRFKLKDRNILQYGKQQGSGDFRIFLANFLSAQYGEVVDPDDLFVTAGISQALDLICALHTRPGDTVIVEEPSYFLALRIFADHKLNIIGTPIDENGLIRVGAHIKPGDILIGKITPKGESDPSPEEKLLRAIFGDKAGDVKDASLKAGPSLDGVVVNKKLFSRSIKDKRSKSAEKPIIERIEAEFNKQVEELNSKLVDKLFILVNGKTSQGVKDFLNADIIPKGTKFTQKSLQGIDFLNVNPSKWTTDKKKNEVIKSLLYNYMLQFKEIDGVFKRKRYNIVIGDELPAGIIQLAKVYIAKKRKVKVGDKMAGRHGNKGIVAKIVREEDMPYLEDGTPVDIVLNPLGVPSRMNLGQIYESVLGWAGLKLGLKFATPIFDGATLEQINEYTAKAGLPNYGKTYLYDGGTGERFDQPATVGVIYMLKLGHMVDDKMHARSIGPYSLITQQPLGGKAQFGGQRFGEMEVWALEAFGAANILQEILTVKSDDVIGRAKTYEAIVKGENMPAPGIPESLNVLLHELKGLGLNLKLTE